MNIVREILSYSKTGSLSSKRVAGFILGLADF
jgi:hypothetical protein